jgi:hypothetical protein
MIRQKILILFDHPLALRSYTETGLIDEFNRDYDISIIVMGNIDNYSNQIMNLRISKIESFILSIYANIYWIKIAEKSLSIQNRVWHSKNKFKGFFSAPRIAIFYSRFFSAIPVKAFSLLLFRIFKFLDLKVKKLNPSKIVYITVGGTLTISDFLYTRYRPGIELITILENWDNMSSKAVFAFPPKKIGVWGDQSVNFAERIHDIKRGHVKPIGNPRIDWLLDNVERKQNKTSIFFGGGSVDLDAEIEFLIATLEIAKKFELKIDYLPHPKNYRNIQKFIVHKNLSEINFIGDFHALNSINQILLPKLIDYVNPFQSAKIFVSSLSTMNLEAALLKIPSIAIDLRTNLRVLPNKISDRHDHIFEAKQMGIFNFVSSITEYEVLLKNLLESNGIENPKYNSKSDLNYFVKTDKPFINNFLKLINS